MARLCQRTPAPTRRFRTSDPGTRAAPNLRIMRVLACHGPNPRMTRLACRLLSALIAAAAMATAHAQQPDRLVFATNWLAQAEHGGFYQALAEGTYRKHGLDVTIRMGGPQVNGLQLLAARRLDVAM